MDKSESFRDKVSTVDETGKRIWIFPKKSKGKYYSIRSYLSYLQLIFLFSAPFIEVNGKPLLLFDILNRHFVIFGITFWPQDLHIFGVFLIFLIVFIILFTTVYGRIWCGWLCPQTIFMEMLFRKIEYFIDGDSVSQKRLATSEWNTNKTVKRITKHTLFFVLSFVMGNVFLAYFIGKEDLFKIITSSPKEHLSGFLMMLIFSITFYWIYAWFREQFCCFLCPYARLQSVLLDQNSVSVYYDYKRGEPRGKDSETTGDCIDCNLCHAVCPTGIDIRDGSPQLECIQCTACIDACDKVMSKRKKDKGLIRYARQNEIEGKEQSGIAIRSIIYLVLTVVLFFAVIFLLKNRTEVETTIIRNRGSVPIIENNLVLNVYNAKLLNKTRENKNIRFELQEKGELTIPGGQRELGFEQTQAMTFFVRLPRESVVQGKNNITIDVYADDKKIESIQTTFLGP
jgi:cytochrome c oxidase accessory protein FixG